MRSILILLFLLVANISHAQKHKIGFFMVQEFRWVDDERKVYRVTLSKTMNLTNKQARKVKKYIEEQIDAVSACQGLDFCNKEYRVDFTVPIRKSDIYTYDLIESARSKYITKNKENERIREFQILGIPRK